MKLVRTAIVGAIAKKVIDEARKPHNQERIRRLLAQAQAKAGQRRGGTRPY